MKDWFAKVIMDLPSANDDGREILHINKGQFRQVFMDQERVVGIGHKTLATQEYLEGAEKLSWDEFRKQNIINAMTGKCFYQAKYLLKIAKILQLLNWHKLDVTVYLPSKGVAMVTVDSDTDMALFVAPCIGRDMSFLNPKQTEAKP